MQIRCWIVLDSDLELTYGFIGVYYGIEALQ